MALEILRDPRLGDVEWKDLLRLSRGEGVRFAAGLLQLAKIIEDAP